ncbi:MAG: UDP-N-acetylglucosamine 1-carboxyvinyltransferase, partial [Bacteroidaceae bacterium]|nr:UDP-N-acetylglucosamine 1-carboxyvinyltransferase [Bacteroidaceae bacterium]
MPSFLVEGGHRLKGTICPQGAKNEVLQILCAVLLTPDEVTVQNVPDILDVRNLIDMLANLGVKVQNTAPGCWTFKAENIDRSYAESMDFVAKSAGLRGSVMLLGPLLARLGHATVSKPGGDKIGRRRVDTHIKGFQALGATFVLNEERGYFELKADKLKGTYMLLDEASVTGTANIIMAAVLADGVTTIYNAACEPYV